MIQPTKRPMPPERRSKLDRLHTQRLAAELFEDDLHVKRVESLANGVTGVLRAAALSWSPHDRRGVLGSGGDQAALRGVKQVVTRVLEQPCDRRRKADGRRGRRSWSERARKDRQVAALDLDGVSTRHRDHRDAERVRGQPGTAVRRRWGGVTVKKLDGSRASVGDYETQRSSSAFRRPSRRTCRWFSRPTAASAIRSCTPTSGSSAGTTSSGSVGASWWRTPGASSAPRKDWVPKTGRATMLGGSARDRRTAPRCRRWSSCTRRRCEGAVVSGDVVVRHQSASDVVAHLRQGRFTIEETFRDATKDIRFGMGLSATHIRDAGRRDRLVLLAAIAPARLTFLGAASEATGMRPVSQGQYIPRNAPIRSSAGKAPIGTERFPTCATTGSRTSWRLSTASSPSTPSSARSTRSYEGMAQVGTPTLGVGRWGQLDLVGNVWQWSLDWGGTLGASCTDCAQLNMAYERIVRGGGGYADVANRLVVATTGGPSGTLPDHRDVGIGLRCARSP